MWGKAKETFQGNQKGWAMDRVTFEDQIGQAYDDGGLMDIYTHFFRDFLEENHGFFENHSLDQRVFPRIMVSKKQLGRLLAAIFSDAPVLGRWIKTLSAAVFQALIVVVWEGAQAVGKIENLVGGSILKSGSSILKSSKSGAVVFQKAVRVEFCLFQCHHFNSFWGAEGSVYYLDLPPILRQQLKTVLPVPSGSTLIETATPSNKFVFEDRARVLDVLPTIQSFIRQGRLEQTQQGGPRIKSMLQLRAICGVKEFYDQQQGTELSCLRTGLLAHLLQVNGIEQTPEDALLFLKIVFGQYLKIQTYPHLSFLSHIRGLYHVKDAVNHRLHHTCWDLLCRLPERQWITVEQISGFARLQQLDLEPVLKKQADRYLYITTKWQGWGNKKHYLTPARYEQAMVIPLLKASLFLFGAFGLLDLGYDEPENPLLKTVGKPYLTAYDGLLSVRLTELGAYIAGHRSTFDYAQTTDREIAFELDPERLFISYARPDKLAELFLERFATRIGSMRYKVDFNSFLKECRNRLEVNEKIQLFKKEIGECLPSLWQNFFETVMTRAEVLVPVDDLLVFRVSPRNRALVDIIARDKTIRRYIFKAEGQHILIRGEDLTYLKNRLEELGFLM